MSRILGRIGELGEELECDFDIKEVLYCSYRAAPFVAVENALDQTTTSHIYKKGWRSLSIQ